MVPQVYKKDIMLYSDLKVRLLKRNMFTIDCPISGKTFQIRSNDAGNWVTLIN